MSCVIRSDSDGAMDSVHEDGTCRVALIAQVLSSQWAFDGSVPISSTKGIAISALHPELSFKVAICHVGFQNAMSLQASLISPDADHPNSNQLA